MKFIKVKATNSNTLKDIELYISFDFVLAITENGTVLLKEDQFNVARGNLLIGDNTFSDVRVSNYEDIEKLLLQ